MVGVTSEWMSVVIIMSVGGQYENDYLIIVHLVDKAVFLGYAARPLSGAVARQAVGWPVPVVGCVFSSSMNFFSFL